MRRSLIAVAAVLFAALPAAAREPSATIHGSGGRAVIEGASGLTQVSVQIQLDGPGQVSAFGTYETEDGTATIADNDYVPKSGTFTIPAGQTTSEPIILEVVGDRRLEPNETFNFVVHFKVGANDPAPFVITIVNDDLPVVTVSDARIAEGNSILSQMIFDVTLSDALQFPVRVIYSTSDGTATGGVDYQSRGGTITFDPGVTKQTINVAIQGDTLFEPDETFTLTVRPENGTGSTATGTIVNDDPAPPGSISIVSGNNQQGRLGQRLPQPLVIQVLNTIGQPAPGLAVQWKVTRGNATLDNTSTTTDAAGRASTNITLNSVGVVEVEVTAGGFKTTFTLGANTSFADRARGPVAVPIAVALDQICARNEEPFNNPCRALAALSDNDLTPTLERVAPQQSGAQSKVASEVTSAITAGIGARLAAVRSGVERFSVAGLSLEINGQSVPIGALANALLPQQRGGGAGDDDDYTGWSAFVSGNLGDGERNTRNGALGFDVSSRGLMFGIDRLFGENVFGMSLNLMQVDTDLSDNVGTVDTTGYAFSLYGSRGGFFAKSTPGTGTGMRYDGVHVDGSISAGRNTYDSEHTVAITGLPTARATSENDARVLAVALGTGLEAHHGRTDFDLTLSGTWSRATIDDLREEGDGPLILFVQGHDIDSLVATAGLSVRSAWPVSFGTLLPNVRAEMIHEFEDGARLVTARFLRDRLGTSFTVPLDQPDANYGKISAGLQGVFPRGLSLYVEVTQDVLRSDLEFRTIQVNLSKSF